MGNSTIAGDPIESMFNFWVGVSCVGAPRSKKENEWLTRIHVTHGFVV